MAMDQFWRIKYSIPCCINPPQFFPSFRTLLIIYIKIWPLIGNIYTNTSTGNTDATDDAVSKTENAGYLRPLVDGTLSAALESPYTTGWSVPYNNIRKVNLFLFHIHKSKMDPSTIKRVIAEARFLRAWYYANLVRYFGGVIIMGDKMINPES